MRSGISRLDGVFIHSIIHKKKELQHLHMLDIKTDPPATKFQTQEYLIPKLALGCDIRIASSNSKIGQTEVKIGIQVRV
jgi:1,4-dihydroxy-2-naphthoyl-CoA synthase